MPEPLKEPTIDQMAKGLKAAGWTAKRPDLWLSPHGVWFLGPYGAWKAMQRLKTLAGSR